MKNRWLIITLILLLSILAAGLIIFMIRGLNGNWNFKFFNTKYSNELVVDTTYDETFENLNVSTTAGKIYIHETDSDEFRLVIYGEKEKSNYEANGKTLDVSAKTKTCIGFCFGVESAKVDLYVPKNYTGKMTLKGNYGDITVEEFALADIKIESDAGDVQVDAANTVDINNKYGDVKVKWANIANINDDCGDIKLGTIKDAKIENHYGDITAENITEHANINADCGDIKIENMTLTRDSKIENNMGDVKIGSTNEIYITANTKLGDTRIRNNYREAKVELKISNSCGDINVNN